jgi:UDP-N-acetylglucosamine 4,6-dehydratase
MTRFWITLDQAIDFVLWSLDRMGGGEIFVPRIPSMRITDMAEALAPGVPHRIVGMRPGEKLHEALLTADEARHSRESPAGFKILPEYPFVALREHDDERSLPEGFRYDSDNNDAWIGVDELRALTA